MFYSPPPTYLTDILYISVRLLAPYKSIFALSPESNLSVSAGSGPTTADGRTGKCFWIQNRFDLRIVSPLVTWCPLMKSVSKDIVARSARWTTIWRTHIVRDKHRFEYNIVSRRTLARVSSSIKSIVLSALRGIENKEDITIRATDYINAKNCTINCNETHIHCFN